MSHTIRPFEDADLAQLHAINCAGEPGVGAVNEEKLASLINAGQCLVAVDAAGNAGGFILLHTPEADYDSQNFAWFNERYESFVYVDRIAVTPELRGHKIGETLYAKALETFSGKALLMGCEVNTAPPNPGSMRFHKRLGFQKVGAQSFRDDYAVAYLARRLG